MMKNSTTLTIIFLRKPDLTKTYSDFFPSAAEYKNWLSFQKLVPRSLPRKKVAHNPHIGSTFLTAFPKRLWVLIALENDQHPLHYMANGPFNRKGNNIQLFAPSKTR